MLKPFSPADILRRVQSLLQKKAPGQVPVHAMNLPSPPLKRIKLESSPEIDQSEAYKSTLDEADLDEEHCSICLQPLSDRTLLPECSHEFCFDCILIWTGSCQCPFRFRILFQ